LTRQNGAKKNANTRLRKAMPYGTWTLMIDVPNGYHLWFGTECQA
jgi:uncharacterized protein (DUF3820 family)